ncbi:MAG: MFS transporter, partial [Rickettsiaceae bacterium]|nr:MFS transporter [Rickettsiaceae bacterium]
AQAMARDSYEGRSLSTLYAGLASGLAIMPSVSSYIAGNILEYSNWRMVFVYLSVMVGAILYLCYSVMPETTKSYHNIHVRVYNVVFQSMIRDKKVICYGSIIGIFNGIMYGFYIEAPFIYMIKLNVEASDYGLYILLLGGSAAVGGVACRYLQKKGIEDETLKKSGLALSIFSCAFFVLIAILWDYDYITPLAVTILITASMMIQSFGYAIIMPIILRYALEDYTKINGTAGAIFGTYYYSMVATINLITTYLHDPHNIYKVTFFFLAISICASVLYLMAKSIHTDRDGAR